MSIPNDQQDDHVAASIAGPDSTIVDDYWNERLQEDNAGDRQDPSGGGTRPGGLSCRPAG
jgi:hypothetical protein